MSNLTKAEFIRNGSDVHLYIATPATSIASNFHVSLIREIPRLLGAGMSVTYAHLAGHCHVDDARNLLAVDFLLKSDATDILWWDSDVAAEPGAALKLLAHPGDIVGGAYPLKDDSQRFPVRLVQPMAALCPEAEMLPTGFLRVRRHVMDDLAKRAETLNMDGQIVPIIFERGSFEGQRVGGEVGEQPGVGVQDQVGQMVLGRDHRRARDDAERTEVLWLNPRARDGLSFSQAARQDEMFHGQANEVAA